jgi:hypothetical protein
MAGNTMNTLQSFYNHPLSEFLHRYQTNEKNPGMTAMGELKGSWNVPEEEYPKFLDHLHDYLFVKNYRALGFVERPKPNASKPLLIDLDFHYEKQVALEHRFTEDNIRDFCVRLAEAYTHFFDTSVYESMRFFVTLRPQPYEDTTKIKDGIHILCPDAPLTNEKWNVLRNYLLSRNIISDCATTSFIVGVSSSSISLCAQKKNRAGFLFAILLNYQNSFFIWVHLKSN